jgi:hypothetical protein
MSTMPNRYLICWDISLLVVKTFKPIIVLSIKAKFKENGWEMRLKTYVE